MVVPLSSASVHPLVFWTEAELQNTPRLCILTAKFIYVSLCLSRLHEKYLHNQLLYNQRKQSYKIHQGNSSSQPNLQSQLQSTR